jgi:uncharacterized protein (DUF2235 family)
MPEGGAAGEESGGMGKRIVVCCDGTWQRLDGERPTNVVRLAKAVLPADAEGRPQVVILLDGVGTGRGTTRFARACDRLLGGLTGLGLEDTLAEAYRQLVFAYRPGDEIHVFGYSRGAYTARSLAGMIRNCGILARAHADRVAEALALYRSGAEADKPDGERSRAFRAAHAPDVLTGDDERAWRERAQPRRDWSRAVPLRIRFLGVWDTVGALGVPERWTLASLVNRRHRFHDTCLSSRVEAARHAVAIDERRSTFEPALWDNVDELNASVVDRPYRQAWFPGVHAAVGGGGHDRALASGSLLWVMEGAADRGLAFDPEALAAAASEADPLGPLEPGPARGAFARLIALGAEDRAGPLSARDVSGPARARWRRDPTYRPPTLSAVAADLEGEASPPQEGAPATPQPALPQAAASSRKASV